MCETDVLIQHIYQKLEDCNITKKEIATSLDIDRNTLRNYLTKQTTMPFYIGVKIAKYLEIDLSKIYGMNEESNYTKLENEILTEMNKIDESIRTHLAINIIENIKLHNNRK